MKSENYNKGRRGEEIAKKYLIKNGYEWLESNYKNEVGEIDLIVSKDGYLIFVEVKLKTDDRFGSPEEMINKGKIWRIRKIAESYLVLKTNMAEKFKNYRIDAICIVFENKMIKRISHYKNIEL